MNPDLWNGLSRRERQILELVVARGEATAVEITEGIADAPSHSAVRALIRILEQKGRLKSRKEGKRKVYAPSVPVATVKRSALCNLLGAFFGGSVERAVTALIDESDTELSDAELERLETMIREKREKGGRRDA